MQRLTGVAVTRGTAVGRAVLLVHRGQAVRFPVPGDRVDHEVAQLDAARELSRRQIEAIRRRMRQGRGSEMAALFDAQLLMLDDPMLVGRARDLIRGERVNGEWALQRVLEEIDAMFDTMEDPYLRERKGDIADVIGRLRMNLRQGAAAPRDMLRDIEGPFVLVADELSPSVAAQIDWGRVRGFAMDAGSRTYHTAILARSLQIPAIVGLHDATRRVVAGTTVAIDGSTGDLIIEPTEAVIAALHERDEAADSPPPHVVRGPSETLDGVRVCLAANVDLLDDIATAQANGAEGIGLFRSEFMLREGLDDTTEERQFDVYRQLAAAMAPHVVTVRTFDLDEQRGTDPRRGFTRELHGRGDPSRRRSPLGLRGIRLSLVRQDVLRRQVRAVLRASAHGNLRLLLPFITSVDEVRMARRVVGEEATTLGMDPAAVPVGAMIEVPSAAMTADLLAAEVDFLAIGTNDLIQYTLAVDRTDERVSDLYQPLHPGLLRLLRTVRRAAARLGKPLSVCGEMASDPGSLAVLVGLGLREFSMTPAAIPGARHLVATVNARELTRVAAQALRIGTCAEIERYLDAALGASRQERRGAEGSSSTVRVDAGRSESR